MIHALRWNESSTNVLLIYMYVTGGGGLLSHLSLEGDEKGHSRESNREVHVSFSRKDQDFVDTCLHKGLSCLLKISIELMIRRVTIQASIKKFFGNSLSISRICVNSMVKTYQIKRPIVQLQPYQ